MFSLPVYSKCLEDAAVRECMYICIIVPGHQQLASPSQALHQILNMRTINTDTLMMTAPEVVSGLETAKM